MPEADLHVYDLLKAEYDRKKEQARRAGLLGQITFKEAVLGEEKWELLRSAALVVLPSYSENFGMVALEAMAVGRPVTVTPEVGLAAIVARQPAGHPGPGKNPI